MSPLRLFKDLLRALQGGTDPHHLAAGFALGATLGLVPKGNLLAAVFFLLLFVLRVDKGIAFLSAGFFTGLGYAWDGAASRLGCALLQAPALGGLWTALNDMPLVPLTRLNNTAVLGNLVLGLALFAPLYFGFLRALEFYDSNLRGHVESLPLVRAIKSWSFFEKYQRWLA